MLLPTVVEASLHEVKGGYQLRLVLSCGHIYMGSYMLGSGVPREGEAWDCWGCQPPTVPRPHLNLVE